MLILAFQRLCDVIEPKELNLMWKCLYVEIIDSVKNKCFRRLSQLLSLLISMVQINDGGVVSGELLYITFSYLIPLVYCFFSMIDLVLELPTNTFRFFIDYCPVVDVLALLLETLILPLGITTTEDHLSEIFDKVLELMLCTLDVLHKNDDMSTISKCSLQWAPVFELESSRYFI